MRSGIHHSSEDGNMLLPLGASLQSDGVHFRVWAPTATRVELVIETEPQSPISIEMTPGTDGDFATRFVGVGEGTRYRFRIDGKGPFPDPVSRFQPDGVHGPSEVIDPSRFVWSDTEWKGRELADLVIYECHIGTFTPEGTFAAATDRLAMLAELGISAIELMPLADFPGTRNWGYDGVSLYAPARCYGRPDDLRRFVATAHSLGLAVILDVVYNHLGPDGNYLACFSPFYFSTTHQTAWGQGPNFDGDHQNQVDAFFIGNALHWIREYHFDGLRLDATHAIQDDSEPHFLDRLTRQVHQAGRELGRTVLVIAEDERNLAQLVKPHEQNGFNLDGVWADDFHHEVRRRLTGESEGYYADYSGSVADLADTLQQGWFYHGQPTLRSGQPRGTDPGGIPRNRFIHCIQNHDQIGNRAFGERLNHQVSHSAYRAASALLLLSPETPLLFMGQEWAASSPFLFFTDHNADLGRLVTEGRRKEFRKFAAFADPLIRRHIPDPQALSTWDASRLNWEEREQEPHAGMLRLYRDLLRVRRTLPAFERAEPITDGAVALRYANAENGSRLMLVAALVPGVIAAINEPGWITAFTTEDNGYTASARRPALFSDAEGIVLHFPSPAAVLLHSESRSGPRG